MAAGGCPLTWRPSQSVVPHVLLVVGPTTNQLRLDDDLGSSPPPSPPGGRRPRHRRGGGEDPPASHWGHLPLPAWGLVERTAPQPRGMCAVRSFAPANATARTSETPRVVAAACPHLEGGGGRHGHDEARRGGVVVAVAVAEPDPPCSLSSFVTRLLVLGTRSWTHWWFTAPGASSSSTCWWTSCRRGLKDYVEFFGGNIKEVYRCWVFFFFFLGGLFVSVSGL